MVRRLRFTEPVVAHAKTFREPIAIEETIQFREVGDQQVKWKKKLAVLLLAIRFRLTKRAALTLSLMKPAEFHTLILSVEPIERAEVVAILESAFKEGRILVAKELERQSAGLAVPEGATAIDTAVDAVVIDQAALTVIDQVADATITQTLNNVQASATNSAASATILKSEGPELRDKVEKDLQALSEAPIENQAAGAANAVLNEGRAAEMGARGSQIDRYMYSAVNDQNSCLACIDADQETGPTLDSITPTPNPSCSGGERCRCFCIALIDDTETD